ncbi:MAG: hypothetical protein HGGPFJEG_02312 [Ignavibacteria bacterium]|nr:hypothetical protein [Ignavibacteria bacterium]
MKHLILIFLLMLIIKNSVSAVPAVDNHIKVDQFGYRTEDRKIAVISNPVIGYNNNNPFTPGNNYQVRRFSDDVLVYSGTITAWNGGVTQSQSGDKVWWFEFTALNTPGNYYVYDVLNNVRSYQFQISDSIHSDILKQALRVFYYQRCGTSKSSPYAEFPWTDDECHIGNLQDIDCRLYNNNNPSTSKNLSGGWHDAGDYNKYVNFTFEPMIDLLLGYEENPLVWKDNYNIPESGNGIPDVLDEVRYELEWLLKMQNANGSVLCIVGVRNYAIGSPPSADLAQRIYGPATTSASFTASALFALGAIQFNSIGQTAFANTLQTASINAYNWAVANPSVNFYNSGLIGAGEQETDQYGTLSRKMAASAFLFKLTGNSQYKTFFENNYTQMHLIQWTYAYPFESAQQDIMLYYASIPGVSPSVSIAIRNAYKSSMNNSSENLPAYINNTDAYRAYLTDQNYTWGSNTTKAREGNMFYNMIHYKLDTTNNSNYRNAGLGYLNYFNGINPTAYCYLTNMSNFGSENSISRIYHAWFSDTVNLPPPCYLSGGPNPYYSLDGCCPSGCGSYNSLCNTSLVTPPLNQPKQKSYKDWNISWPQNSWTVTEPAIYTQAAYARLVSQFVKASPGFEIKLVMQGFYNSVLDIMNMKDTVRVYFRNNFSPYSVIDSVKTTVDSVSFKCNFTLANLSSGTYFIVIRHRNSIETWSKAGGEIYTLGSQFNFDFTSDSTKAYGNNIIKIDDLPGIYGIYGGDINQNEIVDGTDNLLVDNDANAFTTGYVKTDVNGDMVTDASDAVLTENNAQNFVSVIKP